MVFKAVQSVINQTYPNIEIIVVDDGSNDGTGDFLKDKFGDKIKHYFKQNGGVSSARNYGISVSSGSLIAFLDSDDIWLPEKIEFQVDFLKKNENFGMVLCDCYFVDESGDITGQSCRRKVLKNDGYIVKDVLVSPSLIPSSVLVRKSVLEDSGYFDEYLNTAEDIDLHLRISMRHKIGLIEKPLFKYMRGNDGLSNLSSGYEDNIKVVERFIILNKELIDNSTVRKVFFKIYSHASIGKRWYGEINKSIYYNLKAIFYIHGFRDFSVICFNFFGIGKFLIAMPIKKILKKEWSWKV